MEKVGCLFTRVCLQLCDGAVEGMKEIICLEVLQESRRLLLFVHRVVRFLSFEIGAEGLEALTKVLAEKRRSGGRVAMGVEQERGSGARFSQEASGLWIEELGEFECEVVEEAPTYDKRQALMSIASARGVRTWCPHTQLVVWVLTVRLSWRRGLPRDRRCSYC